MKLVKGDILDSNVGKWIVTEEPSGGNSCFKLNALYGNTIGEYHKWYNIDMIKKRGFKKLDEIYLTFAMAPGDAINKFKNIMQGTVSMDSRGRLNPNDVLIDEWKLNLDVHYHELRGLEKGNGYIAGFEIK